jgi:DNA repair protein RadC
MPDNQSSPLNIKAWAEEDRPREKLIQKGRASLTDAELLGILIGSGIRNMTAVDLSKLILQSVSNDLNKLAKLSVKDLSKFKGIGEAKAITIVSALELGRRRKESDFAKVYKVNSARLAYDYFKPFLLDLPHEEFWILILNQSSEVIKAEKISSGGVTGTVADPKIIFKSALEHLGTQIILCHNHPSGNLKPSQADINLTKKLIEAGKILDIFVIDHIIFCNQDFLSFRDDGLM